MNVFFSKIKNDRMLFWGYLGSLIFIICNLAIIGFYYSHLPPFIPLYNQMPWGEARLGEKIEIFIPVLIIFLVFIVNFVISSIYYEKVPLISRILSFTSILISFLMLLFIIRTIRIIL